MHTVPQSLALLVPHEVLSLSLPGLLGRGGLHGASASDVALLRMVACTLMASSAAEISLMDAASAGRLGSATYQRLMWGISAKSVSYVVAYVAAWPLIPLMHPAVVLSYPLLATLSAGVSLQGAAGEGGIGGGASCHASMVARRCSAAPPQGGGCMYAHEAACMHAWSTTLAHAAGAAACVCGRAV